ncbi:MAG: cytochrome c [Magnetococcales bacterium]|nr:cytochrome c [Magnetococcales bacterium]
MKKTTCYSLILLLVMSFIALPVQARETNKERYVAGVVEIIRHHAASIRLLAKTSIRYSGNIPRHALELKHSFGLLGPMDWHAAKAASLQKDGPNTLQLKQEDFENLANKCMKKIKKLHKVAVAHVKSGDQQAVLNALDVVQTSCDGCHSLLDDVSPNVWGDDK